jgi:hypothetical protein
VYKILGYPAFQEFDKKYPFELDENRPYSYEIHKILKTLSLDISGYNHNILKDNTAVIICDVMRGEYEQIRAKESWMDKHFKETIHPVYYALTMPGIGIAEYSWNKLLSGEQRDIIDFEVRSYHLGKY